MTTAAELIGTLRGLGFFDFLLPWIFTFAVVYGLLMVVKIFGDDKLNQKISATIALVAAFFATAFAGRAMAMFFASLFGNAVIILAGILVIGLLLAMVGIKFNQDDKLGLKRKSVMIVLIIIGIILFIASTGAASGIGYWALLSPDMIALIIVLIVIIAAVHMIVSDSGSGGGGGDKKGG